MRFCSSWKDIFKELHDLPSGKNGHMHTKINRIHIINVHIVFVKFHRTGLCALANMTTHYNILQYVKSICHTVKYEMRYNFASDETEIQDLNLRAAVQTLNPTHNKLSNPHKLLWEFGTKGPLLDVEV